MEGVDLISSRGRCWRVPLEAVYGGMALGENKVSSAKSLPFKSFALILRGYVLQGLSLRS